MEDLKLVILSWKQFVLQHSARVSVQERPLTGKIQFCLRLIETHKFAVAYIPHKGNSLVVSSRLPLWIYTMTYVEISFLANDHHRPFVRRKYHRTFTYFNKSPSGADMCGGNWMSFGYFCFIRGHTTAGLYVGISWKG